MNQAAAQLCFFGYKENSNASIVTGDSQCHDELEALRYFNDNRTSIRSLNDYYSAIKKVFLKYNTPLPTLAPVERRFSFAGHVFLPRQEKLLDNLLESCMMDTNIFNCLKDLLSLSANYDIKLLQSWMNTAMMMMFLVLNSYF